MKFGILEGIVGNLMKTGEFRLELLKVEGDLRQMRGNEWRVRIGLGRYRFPWCLLA
jgi:hypothetical protein